MSKEQVSKNYMDLMKGTHGHKGAAKERNVLIIGSNKVSNIGNAIAEELAKYEDDFVNITEVNEKVLDVAGNNSEYDFSQYDTIIFANGITYLSWFEDIPDHMIDDTFNINVVGPLKTARHFVKQTIDASHSKYIVFIGSMAYKAVLNASVAYCASKAALAHAAKCLAWELTPKGYNVFCVHPSNVVGTPMTEETIKGIMRYRYIDREQAQSYWASNNPRVEFLLKEEIAKTVAMLISGSHDYLSGSQIELSGGQR